MDLLQFTKSRRGAELIGILILAAGVTLAAALVTYHPNDSSAFYTSTNTTIANAIGYYGATIAWIVVSFFGFAGLLFPLALMVVGWNRFWGKEIEYAHTKLIGFVILAFAIPPMFDLTMGKLWFRNALIPAGGYLGQEVSGSVVPKLNVSGAAIVFVTAILIGLLLSTRISLGAIFLAFHQLLLSAGRRLSMHWARFSERRRKDKMKETVLRKHLDREGPALRLVTDAMTAAAPSKISG